MSDAELRKKRATAKTAFTRARKNLEDSIDRESLAKTVERKFDELKLAWKEAQRCHERYVTTLDDVDTATAEESWMDELDEIYNNIENRTDKYLDHLERQQVDEVKRAERERAETEEKHKEDEAKRIEVLPREKEKERVKLQLSQEETMF